MHQNIESLYQHYLNSSGISIDSRKITSNCLFFALRGEKFDGNKYARPALGAGARLAVVDDQELAAHKHCFVVKDVLATLQELALYHRHKLNIPILGVTGSNGKTTTKELIGRVLAKKYQTFFTRGNLNNHIGVPLSLLSIKNNTEMAIIEMGANHPGEIADLCRIAKPDFGIITNIGKAHLEGFGNFQGVINAKNELYQFMALNHGKVFVNADDPLLMKLATKLSIETYGSKNDAGLSGFVMDKNPFLKVRLKLKSGEKTVQTQLIGDYNLPNILAAACVGRYFHVDDHLICKRSKNLPPGTTALNTLKPTKIHSSLMPITPILQVWLWP
jgi:UDP-N-acetylmuramoyl-tripeptide--D-alanyl-D-alanine ligase